jgi:hypothetical protein
MISVSQKVKKTLIDPGISFSATIPSLKKPFFSLPRNSTYNTIKWIGNSSTSYSRNTLKN